MGCLIRGVTCEYGCLGEDGNADRRHRCMGDASPEIMDEYLAFSERVLIGEGYGGKTRQLEAVDRLNGT